MKKNSLLISGGVLLISIVLTSYFYFSGSEDNGLQNGSVPQENDGTVLKKETNDSGNSLPITDKDITSKPAVGVNNLPPIQQVIIVDKPTVGNKQDAQKAVNEQAASIGLSDDETLEVSSSSNDEYGNAYYQIQQHYKGVPVYGARALLEVQHGKAEILSGSWQLDINLEIEPTNTAQGALIKAVEDLQSTSEIVSILHAEPRLIIYVSTVKVHLAWLIHATVFKGGEAKLLIIDAHRPIILMKERLRRY